MLLKNKIIIIDGVDFVSHVFIKVEVGSTLGWTGVQAGCRSMSRRPRIDMMVVECHSFAMELVFVATVVDVGFHAAPDLRGHSGLEVLVASAH